MRKLEQDLDETHVQLARKVKIVLRAARILRFRMLKKKKGRDRFMACQGRGTAGRVSAATSASLVPRERTAAAL